MKDIQQKEIMLGTKQKSIAKLPIYEIVIYAIIWICSVLYSIYKVFLASRKYYSNLVVNDLDIGLFSSPRWRMDVTDAEWHYTTDNMIYSIPFLLFYFIISKNSGHFTTQTINVLSIIISITFIYKLVGYRFLLMISIQPMIMFIVFLTKSTFLVYAISIGSLFVLDNYFTRDYFPFIFNDENVEHKMIYAFAVTFGWFNLRCISFCLDHFWGNVKSKSLWQDLINYLSYLFYLPLIMSGPIVNYDDFKQRTSFGNSGKSFLIGCVRFLFWAFVFHLGIHYLYFNALHYHIEIVKRLDTWTLCGIGYTAGQFFHLKYIVFYGFSSVFLKLDGITSPLLPKCITRINLYSEMWRYFDNGLYKFIHKYFYSPILKKLGKGMHWRLFGSAMTFGFIYVWHGLQIHIMYWSLFNFIGITIEILVKSFSSTSIWLNLAKNLSEENMRRIYALLSSPLFMFSILSNFYFFLGKDVGDILVENTAFSFPANFYIILILYCASQISYEVKRYGL